jgi:hypothetical protein
MEPYGQIHIWRGLPMSGSEILSADVLSQRQRANQLASRHPIRQTQRRTNVLMPRRLPRSAVLAIIVAAEDGRRVFGTQVEDASDDEDVERLEFHATQGQEAQVNQGGSGAACATTPPNATSLEVETNCIPSILMRRRIWSFWSLGDWRVWYTEPNQLPKSLADDRGDDEN